MNFFSDGYGSHLVKPNYHFLRELCGAWRKEITTMLLSLSLSATEVGAKLMEGSYIGKRVIKVVEKGNQAKHYY